MTSVIVTRRVGAVVQGRAREFDGRRL